MNGSIIYEVDRPENTGLNRSIKVYPLESVFQTSIIFFVFNVLNTVIFIEEFYVVILWLFNFFMTEQILGKAKAGIDDIQKGI
jgi:hypothetical protein